MSFHSRINEKNRTINFFIRRFFRIAPLFYLMLIATFITSSIITSQNREFNIFELLINITFTNGFFPQYGSIVAGGWSIAVEFVFYFMLPFICTKIKNLNSSLLFVIITLLFSSAFNKILFLIIPPESTHFMYYSIVTQLPVFSLGILAYWILNDRQKNIKPITILAIGITVLFYCYFLVPYHFVYSLFFVLLTIVLALKPYKLLSNKVLANIGKVSFSIYLTHFLFTETAKEIELAPITNLQTSLLDIAKSFVIVFVCSYLLSSLTYKYIEVPGQNWGRKLIRKISC